MPEPLSPADRSSLNSERGPINMAMVGLILVEDGPGVSHASLCDRIAERIHLMPRYRQRLQEPRIGLVNPVWVDDEHFDVAWHVHHMRVDEPGDDAALGRLVGQIASCRMDRSRPLWELYLVDGLSDGRVALVVKLHHALVDGVGAIGIAPLLIDPTPEPMEVEPPEEEWTPDPYRLRKHVARMAAAPVGRWHKLAQEATERVLDLSPRSAANELRDATELVTELARNRPAAPGLPINRPISANRSFVFTRAGLDEVKGAGKAAGGTVNEAVLATVSGMLARYLAEAGVVAAELPRDPVALVPVNLREEGDEAGGNRISVVFVDLPVGEPSFERRVELLHDRMEAIKGSAAIQAGALTVDMSGFAPPLMSSMIARSVDVAMAARPGGGPAFNIVVSNVPGPQIPLYFKGSRVLAVHPAVPLNPADQGLAVGVFSYDGNVCFGLTADRDLDPPVERARAALDEALADLR